MVALTRRTPCSGGAEYSEDKKIEIYYLWGDQEPCFHYAYHLAQKMYSAKNQRVYKLAAGSAEDDGFAKNYASEECLLLLGLTAEDIPLWKLNVIISGGNWNGIDFGKMKTIIIAAKIEPIDFTVLDDGDWYDMKMFLDKLTCEYEVRKTDESETVRVSSICRDTENVANKRIAHSESIDVAMFYPTEATVGYFEKYDLTECVEGTKEEIDQFIDVARRLPIRQQRKLCAALQIEAYFSISVKEAMSILEVLDDYEFAPHVLNYKDLGYMLVSEQGVYSIPLEIWQYVDFTSLGRNFLYETKGIAGISKYGFIRRKLNFNRNTEPEERMRYENPLYQ